MKITFGDLVPVEIEDGERIRIFCGLCQKQIKNLQYDGDITVICESCRYDYNSSMDTIYALEERLEKLQADNKDLEAENALLHDEMMALQTENERLKDELVNVRHNIETQ